MAQIEQILTFARPTAENLALARRIEAILDEENPERLDMSRSTDKGIFCPSPLDEVGQILSAIRHTFPAHKGYLSLGSGDGSEAFLAALLGFEVTAAEYDYELSQLSEAVEGEILKDIELTREDDFFDLQFKDYDVLYYYDRGCSDQQRLIEKIQDEMKPGALLCVYRQSDSWPPVEQFCEQGFKVVGQFRFQSALRGEFLNTFVYQRTEVPFYRLSA